MEITVKVLGEADRKIEIVGREVRDSLEKGAEAGAIIIERAFRDNIRSRGWSFANLVTHETKSKTRDRARITVGLSKDMVNGKRWWMIFHLLEYGHAIRNRKGGRILGIVPAYPTLRPAIDENEDAAARAVFAEFRKAIVRAAR